MIVSVAVYLTTPSISQSILQTPSFVDDTVVARSTMMTFPMC